MGGEQGLRARNLSLTGVVLLVVIGVCLVDPLTDKTGTPKPAPVEIRTGEILLDSETVDLKNGNIRLQIQIRAATKKAIARDPDRRAEYLPLRLLGGQGERSGSG